MQTGRITQAIASFQRALVSFESPYDLFRRGVKGTLSESALRGHTFFNEEKGECYHCHFGPELSSAYATVETKTKAYTFHNTGLYDPYPAPNRGLFELTQQPEDLGFFRVPSLRNIALDRSVHARRVGGDVVRGARHLRGRRPRGGEGAPAEGPAHPPVSTGTAQEKEDLLAFLNALTDASLVTDERFANPWK